jgi:hypothetical protein
VAEHQVFYVVWLSDGGRGLWSVFQRLFQAVGAVAILDFYPAAQNLYKGASAWLDGRTRACQQWFADFRHRLRHGHEQHVLAELAALVEAPPLPPSARQTLINVYTYLKTHEDPIHYEYFKLKMLKRQMYGRAGIDLLSRRRFLLAA